MPSSLWYYRLFVFLQYPLIMCIIKRHRNLNAEGTTNDEMQFSVYENHDGRPRVITNYLLLMLLVVSIINVCIPHRFNMNNCSNIVAIEWPVKWWYSNMCVIETRSPRFHFNVYNTTTVNFSLIAFFLFFGLFIILVADVTCCGLKREREKRFGLMKQVT